MDDVDAVVIAYRHVLVALDGSEFALAAIPTAHALADRFGAALVTVSVAQDDRDADRLRRHAADALGRGPEHRVHVIVSADPAASIRAVADELGACLICLSSRGRGRVAGTVIGSVARAVLQSSPDPIVVVGPQADRPPALHRSGSSLRRPASWPAPLSVRRFVACVDGSPESEQLLSTASAWASVLGMSLTIVTVAEDVPAPLRAGEVPSRHFGPGGPEQYVAALAAKWSDANPGAAGLVVRDPLGVASGIRAHLDDVPAGLVGLTTHARSGLDRVRFGAAAADIVRAASAPALVVPLRG